MSGLFTPDELRLLAISDKAQGGGGRRRMPRKGKGNGRSPSGYCGSLTDAEAFAMIERGCKLVEIADAAGITPASVSCWKSRRGRARDYNWKGKA